MYLYAIGNYLTRAIQENLVSFTELLILNRFAVTLMLRSQI
ncbi:hypothetical protein [Tolypothrix sp. FACHB-123]|nr:hypothetical protein [Tolypothrix sp. FACHB-123]